MDSVSTNSGAFAKPKAFDAKTTSRVEIQGFASRITLQTLWPPSTLLTSMVKKNAGW